MKETKAYAFAAAMFATSVFAAPTITVDSVVQRWPWNNKVDITYTISEGGQDLSSFEYRKVSFTATVNGVDYPIDGSSDIIAPAWNGQHTVTWTPPESLKVKASDCTMTASLYETDAYYMVVDLETGAYAFDDLADGDTATSTPTASNARYNSDLYKTDRMAFRRIPRTSAAPAAYSGGYPTGHADYAAPTYTGGYTNTPTTWVTDRDYFVGLFEVTQGQHLKCGISASGFSGEGYDNRLLPQTSWSWFKCNGNVYKQNLCAAPKSTAANNYSIISRLKAKTDLNGFTLPSSVMWEIAARAGATTIYPWGDSWKSANAFAGWSPQRTIAVGSKNSNDWGLFDMIGNAAEHTLDSYLRFDLGTVPADPWTPVTEVTLGVSRNFLMEVRGGRAPNASTSNELKASHRGNLCNYEQSNNCLGFRVFFVPNM